MPGVNPTFQSKEGPLTYEVSANVTGGQVVEADTAATSTTGLPVCKPGTAGSVKVLGVAFRDAVPISGRAALEAGTTAYPGGFATNDISVPDETVAVYHDVWIPVIFTAACAYRARIKAAANGAVAPFVEGTDADRLAIGWCAQVGGVASAGLGLARILV